MMLEMTEFCEWFLTQGARERMTIADTDDIRQLIDGDLERGGWDRGVREHGRGGRADPRGGAGPADGEWRAGGSGSRRRAQLTRG